MTAFVAWAARQPEKPALIEAESGRVVTFGELAQRAQRLAQWLVSQGLQAGEGVALLLENRIELLELALACRLAGVYYTAVSTHLAPAEVAYILRDSEARAVFVSASTQGLLTHGDDAAALRCFSVDPGVAGCVELAPVLAAFAPQGDLPSRPGGRDLLYSSGTTGRPKGVRRPLVPFEQREQLEPEVQGWKKAFFFDEHSVYLSTAPLYHAAPLRYVVRTLCVGGTCVVMGKFDAQAALAAIERYRVTHSQWVPTMFSRLLHLPADVRQGYDVSSMRMAVHAAAPCPVAVKQAMLDWWGDVIYEYYAGSEGAGSTFISPQQWRAHPGSVGRPLSGQLHILDDEGRELPPGEVGRIYFSGVATFEYLNDPEKTREAYNERGWATYGDIGHVDAEGFLYLSDRRADLILSGGVNVYPQEIENALALHPAVADVAVVGVPDPDLGEVPKAVVSLKAGHVPGQALADELVTWGARHLARLKLPRTVVFEPHLPRLETGKLLRRVLKDRFRQDPGAGYTSRP